MPLCHAATILALFIVLPPLLERGGGSFSGAALAHRPDGRSPGELRSAGFRRFADRNPASAAAFAAAFAVVNGPETNASGDGTASSSLLLHAVASGDVVAVQSLLQHRASPFTTHQHHGASTPLELAARRGDSAVVAALLAAPSPLAWSLAALRVDLRQMSRGLPDAADRWPLGPVKGDGMGAMRLALPRELRPSSDVLDVVGPRPANWVLLYLNRVMCAALAEQGRASGRNNATAVAAILAEHGYDAFAREYVSIIAVFAAFLIAAASLFYLTSRLRVCGCLSAPTSLVPFVPGAFDPRRLADPDFDPSRQQAELPHTALRVGHSVFGFDARCFIAALVGVHCAWTLQAVRIPPEKDPCDEDYASDDDTYRRIRVRQRCAQKARYVRLSEIFVRNCVLADAVWQLAVGARRPSLALLPLYAYFSYSVIASAVASGVLAVDASDSEASGTGASAASSDAAQMSLAIFGVQHGPKWTRALTTVRSTAMAPPPRVRRVGQLADEDGEAKGDTGAERRPDIFVEFKQIMMAKGLLHVPQGHFLARAMLSLITVATAVLYLLYIGPLWGAAPAGQLQEVYRALEPSELFHAYGLPGSFRRFRIVGLEVALVLLIIERAYCVALMLDAAALSLWQRGRALAATLAFAGGLNLRTLDDPAAALERSDQVIRCIEFGMQLSSLRWAVLRSGVLLAYIGVAKLLLASLLLASDDVWAWSAGGPDVIALAMQRMREWVSAASLFGAAGCAIEPLVSLLVAGALANRQLGARAPPLAAAARAGAAGEGELASAVEARLRACALRWPGGHEIGLAEPCLLLALTAATGVALWWA